MQHFTAEQAETKFHYNDTVSYHTVTDGADLTVRGTGRGTVQEIEEIGGQPFLVILPTGAAHTVRIPAYVGVEVEHPAMDLPALAVFIGAKPEEQDAVAAFSGERYGHAYSLEEATTIAHLWNQARDGE